MNFPFDITPYQLSSQDIQRRHESWLITKWGWDYSHAHRFQREAMNCAKKTGERFLILCSHPDVLTYGRGLQKPKAGQKFDLQDTDISKLTELPVPLYKIERGGGLTFHHSGQIILYPITRLHPERLGLSTLVDLLLDTAAIELAELGLDQLDQKRELLGLWRQHQKIASVGIAIERLVTFHGMAVNIKEFDELRKKISFLIPCGLNFNTYVSAEELLGKDIDSPALGQRMAQRILHAW